jgi:hypothetical protein
MPKSAYLYQVRTSIGNTELPRTVLSFISPDSADMLNDLQHSYYVPMQALPL